jgi:invasion protein IalB
MGHQWREPREADVPAYFRYGFVVLAACVAAGVVAMVFSGGEAIGQASTKGDRTPAGRQQQAQQPAPQPAQQQQQQQPQQQPSVPTRTETITYDNWVVTCREPVGASPPKKTCSAMLQLIDQRNNQRTVLLTWIIARNNEGGLISLLQTPTGIQGGISITKGVELKIGNTAARKLTYVACAVQRCEATTPMDAAVLRDWTSGTSATAIIHTANDRAVNINNIPITGIDKAISAIGR